MLTVFTLLKELVAEMAEGKRVTIYLPDGLHEEMKEVAWSRRQSLSLYIRDLHFAEMKRCSTGGMYEPPAIRSYSKDEQLGKK